ncbi:MAG: hypothetical protein HAW67_00565 [Endozoicomonadaceae bacterium]|nr:hypothetical protein [Endozoicomonadaceae bacterium]
MANRINITELDFDQIKRNITDYLAASNEFRGFDFAGSALSLLIEILAYNTYYSAAYTNLAVNESFLDSASKRDSIVSLAKMLGYIPRSTTSARASISVSVTGAPDTPEEIRIFNYSPFSTTVDDVVYTFYTDSEYTARKIDNNYTFDNIELIEGTPILENIAYATGGQRIILRNPNIDISTLKINIQPSRDSATITGFARADNLLNLNSESNVYFIREIDGGQYELSFGDGILGKELEVGNIINLTYFVSNAELANNARLFSYDGNRLGDGNITVTALSPARGGRDRESRESIRHNAPRYHASQDRAVTVNDYAVLLSQRFPKIRTLNIYGGEDNIPAVYGKVFVAIGEQDRNFLTQSEKDEIINYLRSKNIVSVIPEIVEADYLLLDLNVNVSYDTSRTTLTSEGIRQIVIGIIHDYDTEILQEFGSSFHYSNLVSLIDNSDDAILNSNLTLVIKRFVKPKLNINAEYNINLLNPIIKNRLSTTAFRIPFSSRDHFLDDLEGIVRLYNLDDGGTINIISEIGTIDYNKGIINISNLNITDADNNTITFNIIPSTNDVTSVLNQIVQIDRDKLQINVQS